MVTEDLKTAEAECKPRQATIFHYTDVKGALGILKSGELWFTERSHLNDTAELMYGFRIARELFDNSAKKRNPPIPDVEGYRLKETHKTQLEQFGYWIFSASLNNDDLGQWQRYADDGRGVCLGFSVEKLESMFHPSEIKILLPQVHHARHFRVSYCESRLRANLQRYVDCALAVLGTLDLPPKDHVTLLDEQEVFLFLNGGIYMHSMLHKHPAYQREEEYRLLISGQRDTFAHYDCHCMREQNREIVGYLHLPIPALKPQGLESSALTHVRVGPAAPDQLKGQIWWALRSFGIPTFAINPDKSDIPYRSN